MKALSLWQPWAAAMCRQLKRYETRSWATNYRGPLVIHAAKKKYREEDYDPLFAKKVREDGLLEDLKYGQVICLVNLTGIYDVKHVRDNISNTERLYGNYDDGRFAWETEFVQILKSEPCVGHQGLFNWWPPTVPPASLSLPVQERDT